MESGRKTARRGSGARLECTPHRGAVPEFRGPGLSRAQPSWQRPGLQSHCRTETKESDVEAGGSAPALRILTDLCAADAASQLASPPKLCSLAGGHRRAGR